MNTQADSPPAVGETSELDLIDEWYAAKDEWERHSHRCHNCPTGYQGCDEGRKLRSRAVATASAAGAQWL